MSDTESEHQQASDTEVVGTEVTRGELLSGSIALKKPTSPYFSASLCVPLVPFTRGNFKL